MKTIIIIITILLVLKSIKEIIVHEMKKGLDYFTAVENLHKYVSKVYDRYKASLCGDDDISEFVYEDWEKPHIEDDFDDDMREMAIKESNTVRFLQYVQDMLDYDMYTLKFTDLFFRSARRKFNKKYANKVKMLRGIEAKLNSDDRIRDLLRKMAAEGITA